MKKIYFNGRFLTKSVTGIQRFSREIILALDNFWAEEKVNVDATILVPQGASALGPLRVIKTRTIGSLQGHLWEQIELWRASRDGFLVNLAACGPLFKRDQITVIHDAAVYRKPENFSFLYVSWHRILGVFLSRFSRIATVSEFSKSELTALLRILS